MIKKLFLALLLTPLFSIAKKGEPITILSDIFPVQQIAKAITYKTGVKHILLIDSFLSPHNYQFTPKEVVDIQRSDLVIWIGEPLTPRIKPAINKRKESLSTITVLNINNLKLLNMSDDHNHEHRHDHKHNHKDSKKNSLTVDPHVWLSPSNAIIIAKSIAKELITLDPNKKDVYKSNLNNFINNVATLKDNINSRLSTIEEKPYYVFHDAYGYFESDFSLKNKGVFKTSDGKDIGTRHYISIRDKVAKTKGCIFIEPQFNDNIVKRLKNDKDIKLEVLDPMGKIYIDKENSINEDLAYIKIIKGITDTFYNCLKD